jgi:hypothetical protein
MHAIPQRERRLFLKRAWVPLLVTLAGLLATVVCSTRQASSWSVNVAFGVYALGVLYFVVQAVGRFCLRQWKGALWASLRLIGCSLLLIPAAGMILVSAMFGPSEDNFAKGLQIPTNIEVAMPLKESPVTNAPSDEYQKAILSALRTPSSGDSRITPAVPSLRKLSDERPLLIRYLASHPGWHVYEERGAMFATRRWQRGGAWRMSLHGYYSSSDSDPWSDELLGYFQCRITIGLDGKAWAGNSRGATRMEEGTNTQFVLLGKGNNADESYCLINCGKLSVELFEQSNGPERRVTKVALTQLEAEFSRVMAAREWTRSLLPPNATRSGKPTLDFFESFQPGIYDVEGWLNPGEPGVVYLRAYEVTKGTRLSADRLYEKSNERIGWSETADELFLYNSHITIYEGDWGQPYAARFEVWFKPDGGGAERKLFERVFKIEGWQR